MKIYTSYFGNLRKLKANGVAPVSISRWPPKWYGGARYETLAPSANLLRAHLGSADYTVRFKRETLGGLDKEKVMRDLERIAGGRDIALLCYEKPGEFCHRHLVAEWLGGEIEEFGLEKKAEEVQLELF